MRLIHTALDVSDVDATLDFYETLGLEFTHEFTLDGVRNVYVGGEDGLELQFNYDPESDESVDPSGVDYVVVEVDDVDPEFDRIVEDPDGYAVELVGFLD